jgi:hypothetical protein
VLKKNEGIWAIARDNLCVNLSLTGQGIFIGDQTQALQSELSRTLRSDGHRFSLIVGVKFG